MKQHGRYKILSENTLKGQVRTSGLQVFLLFSPLPFPMGFSSHSWIVTNDHGKLDRWEVWQRPGLCRTSWGYVHQNLFPPFTALHKNFFMREKGRYFTRLAGIWENHEDVHTLIRFIHGQAGKYPFAYRYIYYPGPNSNTFIQWVIDHFPQSGFALPSNAFGKSFKHIQRSLQVGKNSGHNMQRR